MKQIQRIMLVVLAALALAALAGASSASATTLELAGAAQNKSVSIEATLIPGGSSQQTETFGALVGTCTASTIKWATVTPFSGTTVSGPISSWSWSSCTEGTTVVDAAGTLSIERIGTTTNGTVRSNGTKFTTQSFFGTLACSTSNTDIGTLTGVGKGTEHAKLDINAVLSCTVVGSVKWSGVYTITSPTGLGVTA
jgi:hypothetical protein